MNGRKILAAGFLGILAYAYHQDANDPSVTIDFVPDWDDHADVAGWAAGITAISLAVWELIR